MRDAAGACNQYVNAIRQYAPPSGEAGLTRRRWTDGRGWSGGAWAGPGRGWAGGPDGGEGGRPGRQWKRATGWASLAMGGGESQPGGRWPGRRAGGRSGGKRAMAAWPGPEDGRSLAWAVQQRAVSSQLAALDGTAWAWGGRAGPDAGRAGWAAAGAGQQAKSLTSSLATGAMGVDGGRRRAGRGRA